LGPHPADHPGPLVFVDDLAAPELEDGDRHHLERVLRLRSGDALTVADGRGRWRSAVLGPTLEVTGDVVAQPAPHPRLTVAFALVKGDSPSSSCRS
jgi:16S rRNA U1498 N3-methylase RsmE